MFLFTELWRRNRETLAPKISYELTAIRYLPSLHNTVSFSKTEETTTINAPNMSMRAPGARSAREEVLGMPELLENILLHLPLTQIIFNAQLVSSFFYETINESPLLQQALFLAPCSMSRPYISQPNPLLYHEVDGRFIDERKDKYMVSEMEATWPTDRNITQLNWREWVQNYRRYTTKGASWRRMLIAQPPIRELLAYGTTLLNGDGATMGQLENAIMPKWKLFHITSKGHGKLG